MNRQDAKDVEDRELGFWGVAEDHPAHRVVAGLICLVFVLSAVPLLIYPTIFLMVLWVVISAFQESVSVATLLAALLAGSYPITLALSGWYSRQAWRDGHRGLAFALSFCPGLAICIMAGLAFASDTRGLVWSGP